MNNDDRRTFLKSTALGVATATTVSAITAKRAAGASQKIRLALIGCGGRGSGVSRDFATLSGVEFAYVCDPDSARAADAVRLRKTKWMSARATISTISRKA